MPDLSLEIRVSISLLRPGTSLLGNRNHEIPETTNTRTHVFYCARRILCSTSAAQGEPKGPSAARRTVRQRRHGLS